MKALAPIDSLDLNTKEGVQAYIALEATRMGVDETFVQNIVMCESQYNGRAVGDSGNAVGLAQFWPETFTRLAKKHDIDPMYLRPDYRSQIKILVGEVKDNNAREWTCSRKYE